MLVLTLHNDEEIVVHLPDGREVVILKANRRQVGIDAPREIRVSRRPVQPRLKLVKPEAKP